MAKDFVCPECDHMFQVSSFRLLIARRTREGKVLRCSRCRKENAYRE